MDVNNELLKTFENEIEASFKREDNLLEMLTKERNVRGTLLKSRDALREAYGLPMLMEPKKIDIDTKEYVGFPDSNKLIDMIHFAENTLDRVWKSADLLQVIKDNDEKSFKKWKNKLSIDLHYKYRTKKLYKIIYGGAKRYTYYTSNPDWVTKEGGKYRLIQKYNAPENDLVKVKDSSNVVVMRND